MIIKNLKLGKKACFSCGVTNQIPPKTQALGNLLQIFCRFKRISPALEMLLLDYSYFFSSSV